MSWIAPITNCVISGFGALRNSILDMKKGESRMFFGYKRSNIYVTAHRVGASIKLRKRGDGFEVWRIA